MNVKYFVTLLHLLILKYNILIYNCLYGKFCVTNHVTNHVTKIGVFGLVTFSKFCYKFCYMVCYQLNI